MTLLTKYTAIFAFCFFAVACGEPPVTDRGSGSGGTAGSGGGSGAAGSGGESRNFLPEFMFPDDCNVGPAQPSECRCTRRCGVQALSQCTRGTGLQVTKRLGVAGGNIDNALRLTVPGGALRSTTRVSVVETGWDPPSNFIDWSPIYLVDFGGEPLATSALFDLPVSNTGNTLPREIRVFRSPTGDGEWEPLSDSYMNAGFVQASLLGAGALIAGYWESELGACDDGAGGTFGTGGTDG